MAEVIARRMAAEIEGDFVVFLIGMRINRIWKPHKWLPVMLAMPRMLRELEARPEAGLLAWESLGLLTIAQYWRSFAQLEAYARAQDMAHWPAWVDFNRRSKAGGGDVGIWHETFLVPAGAYEAIYHGMPRRGLGRARRLVEAVGQRARARGRLGQAA